MLTVVYVLLKSSDAVMLKNVAATSLVDLRTARIASGRLAPCSAGSRQYNIPMTDELLRYRSEFPILERTTYLISNSLGAMPRGVYDAMKGYADTWATRGVRAWEERWWMLAAEVGDEIGALMNAPKGSVSTHQNVTTCQAVVASCFDFSGKRNKVVYTDMNFPSVMYFWEAQRAERRPCPHGEDGRRNHRPDRSACSMPSTNKRCWCRSPM